MWALPWTHGPLPRVHCSLLYLVVSLSVQRGGTGALLQGSEPRTQDPQRAHNPSTYHSDWDNPTCTRNVVVVSRGMRAVMSCEIANNFSQVNVSLCKPEQKCWPSLGVKAPGNLTKDGWHLQVQGRLATLVIEDAQATHAGEYTWNLEGLQYNCRVTVLNVSVEENPICTRNVVVVSRGMRAEMCCKIANNFSQVNVSLCKPEQNCLPILQVKAPGNLTKDGWHLQVQGRLAKLVIEDAQATHAGEYTWNLEGLQYNYRVTVLNVSESQVVNNAKNESDSIPSVAPQAASPRSWSISGSIVVLFLVLLLFVFCHKSPWCPRQKQLLTFQIRISRIPDDDNHLLVTCPA